MTTWRLQSRPAHPAGPWALWHTRSRADHRDVTDLDHKTGLVILDDERCWQLLETHQVGRLAVAIANLPDIFPVNYRVDGRSIVIHTAPGTKLAAGVLGRGVAFEVDELDEERRLGWSVVVQGPAEELTTSAEKMAAEELGVDSWSEHPKYRFMRITPTRVTGRSTEGAVPPPE